MWILQVWLLESNIKHFQAIWNLREGQECSLIKGPSALPGEVFWDVLNLKLLVSTSAPPICISDVYMCIIVHLHVNVCIRFHTPQSTCAVTQFATFDEIRVNHLYSYLVCILPAIIVCILHLKTMPRILNPKDNVLEAIPGIQKPNKPIKPVIWKPCPTFNNKNNKSTKC